MEYKYLSLTWTPLSNSTQESTFCFINFCLGDHYHPGRISYFPLFMIFKIKMIILLKIEINVSQCKINNISGFKFRSHYIHPVLSRTSSKPSHEWSVWNIHFPSNSPWWSSVWTFSDPWICSFSSWGSHHWPLYNHLNLPWPLSNFLHNCCDLVERKYKTICLIIWLSSYVLSDYVLFLVFISLKKMR